MRGMLATVGVQTASYSGDIPACHHVPGGESAPAPGLLYTVFTSITVFCSHQFDANTH